MNHIESRRQNHPLGARLVLRLAIFVFCAAILGAVRTAAQANPAPRTIGVIDSINGNTVALKLENGSQVNVTVSDNTKILRVPPGAKDLTTATALKLADLRPGDHVLVRGTPSADGKTVPATSIIVMMLQDVEAKHQQDIQDWQKRGVGGLVTAVDAASGTITVSTGAGTTTKSIAVHTTQTTIFRRYAPDSVRFADAKPGTITQLKAGDQLRARGDKSEDGSSIKAEEVVSGAFRNVAGIITAIDAAEGTVTVDDAITKKPIVVRISASSQVHKLSPQMAQGIAMRMKGGSAGGDATGRAGEAGGRPGAGQGGGPGAGRGGGDIQQMLARLPAATLADLQKGEAVMVVATEGENPGVVTAITLLGGVDPILRAAPDASSAMLLSPWNLGNGGEGGTP